LKNRHGNHYAHGWLDVPAKYDYLKRNLQKRNPTGSRRKKALSAAAAAQTRARKRSGAQGPGSERARQIIADDNQENEKESNDDGDKDDENMMGSEGKDGEGDDM